MSIYSTFTSTAYTGYTAGLGLSQAIQIYSSHAFSNVQTSQFHNLTSSSSSSSGSSGSSYYFSSSFFFSSFSSSKSIDAQPSKMIKQDLV